MDKRFHGFLVMVVGGAMLVAMAMPAGAECPVGSGGRLESRCCELTLAQGTNDPELTSLADQIMKRMALADTDVVKELDKRQERAFNTETDVLNAQFFKTRCIGHEDARTYIAELSARLRLDPCQQDRVRKIEERMIDDLAPLVQAYCARYHKWMVERYATAPIPPFSGAVAAPDNSIPYAVGGKAQPRLPSRKIQREKGIK